jgi:hypothetical protein
MVLVSELAQRRSLMGVVLASLPLIDPVELTDLSG